MAHVPECNLMELAVDERNQALEGTLVALPPFEKQFRDLVRVLRDASF